MTDKLQASDLLKITALIFIWSIILQIYNPSVILIPFWIVIVCIIRFKNITNIGFKYLLNNTNIIIGIGLFWTILYNFQIFKLPYTIDIFWVFIISIIICLNGILAKNTNLTIKGVIVLIIGIILSIINPQILFTGIVLSLIFFYQSLEHYVKSKYLTYVNPISNQADALINPTEATIVEQIEENSKEISDIGFKVGNNYPINSPQKENIV